MRRRKGPPSTTDYWATTPDRRVAVLRKLNALQLEKSERRQILRGGRGTEQRLWQLALRVRQAIAHRQVKGVNIFTTETYRGQRVQRFVYKGLAPVTKKDQVVVWPAKK